MIGSHYDWVNNQAIYHDAYSTDALDSAGMHGVWHGWRHDLMSIHGRGGARDGCSGRGEVR